MGHWGVVSRQRRSVSFSGSLTTSRHAQVAVQLAVHDEDPAPDDVPGLGDALDRAAAQAEVHGRLALAGGALIAADQVRGRHGAGDQEDPDIIVHAVASVVLAPAQVVQRVLRAQSPARATADR